MRAALYARFSTDLQREESIDDQYRACERSAQQQAFRLVGRFKDEGISGGTSERDGYQQMLSAARAGQFDVIVAEDISRLWRSRAEFGARSAELEDLGIHIVTVVGDDTRRDGYLILGIKLAIAEHQRREIGFRTRRGMEGLALAGKSTGGRCYGYRDNAVYEPEAQAIRRMFAYRAQGYSLGQIAALLTVDGLLPPRYKATIGNLEATRVNWGRSTIAAILANRRYTGAVVWGATESKGGAQDSRRKKHVARSEGPLVSRQDNALAIVSQELFDLAQSVSRAAA